MLLLYVWFEHPRHTYGGFVPSFSERGMPMIILVTTIPTYWILPWWSLRSFAERALGCRGVGLTQGNWTVQFSRPMMLALPSLFLTMRMSKVAFGHRSFAIGHLSDSLAWSSSVAALLLRWHHCPLLTWPKMAEPEPSSHWARQCSCSRGTGLCRASFGGFLKISIFLHLWPIEPVDEKHYNHL
jgi:hypothetical protein